MHQTNVQVRLALPQPSSETIREQRRIRVIGPGERQVASFSDFLTPAFDVRARLRISVNAATEDPSPDNNAATYTIFISLTGR